MDVVGHKYESFVQREMQKRAAAMRKEVREGLSHTAAARMQQGAVVVLFGAVAFNAKPQCTCWVLEDMLTTSISFCRR
jgi:gas vesicle GvpC-like protein